MTQWNRRSDKNEQFDKTAFEAAPPFAVFTLRPVEGKKYWVQPVIPALENERLVTVTKVTKSRVTFIEHKTGETVVREYDIWPEKGVSYGE